VVTVGEPLTETLVTANRILANEGILGGVGHVSVRAPGADEILISQSRSPAFVTASDVIRMDLDGNVLDDPDASPYKETVIHRAIYRHRDDVDAVVHHHAPAVMPFTVTDVEPKPVFHMAALFHEGVPTFADYDDAFGRLVVTEAEGDRMALALGDKRAQLLAGHGANVVGQALEEAVLATIHFVMNAQYQYQAQLLGEPEYYLGPPASIEAIVEEVIRSPLVIERLWEYYTRRLPGRG
jgi:ribulose-5-phosphate 4-epimerase/fuculose-1-phosphate aldolase